MSAGDIDEAALVSPAMGGGTARAVRAQERRSDIDALRGVAICAVVALHTSWTLLTHAQVHAPGGKVLAVVHLASGFGVPLFLALSAISLSLRHAHPFAGAGAYAAFLRKRASRLLPAYVAWSLLSIALRDVSLLWPPQDVAWMLLAGSADIQLYFVPLLFQLYILWPLLQQLFRRGARSRQAFALAGAAAITTLSLTGCIPAATSPLLFLAIHVAGALWTGNVLQDRPAGRVPAMSAAAVVAAASLAATASTFYASLPPVVSPLALVWASYIFQPAPELYSLSIVVLAAAWLGRPAAQPSRTVGRVGGALAALGRRSYGIYLMHLIVASNLTWRLVPGTAAGTIGAAGSLVAAFVLTLAASNALTAVLERYRAVAWLVGAEPAMRPERAEPAVV